VCPDALFLLYFFGKVKVWSNFKEGKRGRDFKKVKESFD